MNKVILTGHLGRSASVRDVEKSDHSGTTPVVNFSLAVKEGYGDRAATLWYDCSWWGEHAARVAEWLTRGRQVMLEGSPGLRTWEKRDGSGMAAALTVRVSSLELLSAAKESHSEPGKTATDTPAKAAGAAPDEDVPF